MHPQPTNNRPRVLTALVASGGIILLTLVLGALHQPSQPAPRIQIGQQTLRAPIARAVKNHILAWQRSGQADPGVVPSLMHNQLDRGMSAWYPTPGLVIISDPKGCAAKIQDGHLVSVSPACLG